MFTNDWIMHPETQVVITEIKNLLEDVKDDWADGKMPTVEDNFVGIGRAQAFTAILDYITRGEN